MQSLRDQLIKAGLISESPTAKTPKGGGGASPTPSPAVTKANATEVVRAQQRLNARQQRELDRRLRQLAAESQVPIEPGDCVFYFATRRGKVRRLELAAAQVKQLEGGALAIVERPEPAQIEHSIVPAATAEQMLRLSATSVRFYAREGAPIGCSDREPDPENPP